MNVKHEIDLHLTRRQFFGAPAQGIGIGALATLLGPDLSAFAGGARSARSADRRTGRRAALRPEGEARHLPPSVRRPVAARDVRLQADAGEVQGTQIPDSVRQGQRVAQTMGQSQLLVAQSAFKFAQHGKSARGSANCCRTPRRSSTTSPSSRR